MNSICWGGSAGWSGWTRPANTLIDRWTDSSLAHIFLPLPSLLSIDQRTDHLKSGTKICLQSICKIIWPLNVRSVSTMVGLWGSIDRCMIGYDIQKYIAWFSSGNWYMLYIFHHIYEERDLVMAVGSTYQISIRAAPSVPNCVSFSVFVPASLTRFI
jgi:hypothetical protein